MAVSECSETALISRSVPLTPEFFPDTGILRKDALTPEFL